MTSRTAGVYGRQSRGKDKSIAEQVDACTADAVDRGWSVVATYRDKTSASRYRRVDRAEWAVVVAAVAAREFDVLVMWSSSRGDRDLTSWSGLLDSCRRSGVLIRITDDERTYDVSKSGDWQALAQQGVGNAVDSDKISASVRRGQAGAAKAGRPTHGRAPFGYRRVYDPMTGKLAGQEPDPTTAPLVVEIFERVAASEPLTAIVRDLQFREVPRPAGGRWHRQRVRDIAQSPAYIGLRTHNGVEYDALWPPLVDAATYYAARRVLADPSRLTTRPGRQVHLLSYLAVCSECGAPLCAVRGRYRCVDRGCVSIVQAVTDDLVTRAVLARLAAPSIYAQLRQAGDDADREAMEARAEVEKLVQDINTWRFSAARGKTTPESLAVIEADLMRQLDKARKRVERTDVPPALRDVLEPGEDVAARWEALTLPAKRTVIRRLIDPLTIGPASVPGSRSFEPERLNGSRWRGDTIVWGAIESIEGT